VETQGNGQPIRVGTGPKREQMAEKASFQVFLALFSPAGSDPLTTPFSNDPTFILNGKNIENIQKGDVKEH